MRDATEPLRRTLARGDLARLSYRLGRQGASGVLTLTAHATRGARPEVFVLRRGAAVCGEGEAARRALIARLVRLAAEPSLAMTFDGSVTAYPPGAIHQVALADWTRAHLEAQLDGPLAEVMVRELAGVRLSLRAELAPLALDDADHRMLAALAQPRRLDQIWPLARTPRFRLLAFLHFLGAIGALVTDGAAASATTGRAEPTARAGPARTDRSDPRTAARDARSALADPPGHGRALDPRRLAALRLLGVDAAADAGTVKRAYRQLARALHPDLQPDADAQRRRTLERRFAEVTAAYEALT